MGSNSFLATVVGAATAVLTTAITAGAADLPVKAAAPVADMPFFFVNDNRLTYAYAPNATEPGYTNKTAMQVLALSHFDVWAYGTNFANLLLEKFDKANPASPCNVSFQGCDGSTQFYGLIRSTFGFNQIFNTKAFSAGPLQNISFEVGADGEVQNNTFGSNKRDIVAGLQFSFALPYRGYFNAAPLFYKEWNHNAFLVPGLSASGQLDYNPTWAFETNYYMDLGFLPQNLQFFSISGRAAWIGPKGTGGPAVFPPAIVSTKTELNSEPIRLTFDASKAMWGEKYSHFFEVWVAYRYWQNKYGADHNNLQACTGPAPGGVQGSCTESSVYSGVTVKF